MVLHDNGFIAKSHISRRWKIQCIESPEYLPVQQQPVYAQEETGGWGKCIGRTTHNATCSAKWKNSHPFLFQAKRGQNQPNELVKPALNFRGKLEHWELGPPHSLWWSKSHLRQFREMPEKLSSFWDNKSRWKTANMAQVCGTFITFMRLLKKISFNWLFASHVLVLSKPLLVFQGFKSENKPFSIHL